MTLEHTTLLLCPVQDFRIIERSGKKTVQSMNVTPSSLTIGMLANATVHPAWENHLEQLKNWGFDLKVKNPISNLPSVFYISLFQQHMEELVEGLPVISTKPFKNMRVGYFLQPQANPLIFYNESERNLIKTVQFGTMNTSKNVLPGQQN